MSNTHPIFAALLSDVREATQTLALAAAKGKLQKDGTRMPNKPLTSLERELLDDLVYEQELAKTRDASVKIIIEAVPYNKPHERWVAYYEGQEDGLMAAGYTQVAALQWLLNNTAAK